MSTEKTKDKLPLWLHLLGATSLVVFSGLGGYSVGINQAGREARVSATASRGSTDVLDSSIKMEQAPNDVPQFKRTYTVRLDSRATMEVGAHSRYFSFSGSARHYRGTLTQPNGNSIWFDPDRIAERILDPTLVPLIQKRVNEIVAADKAFIESNPSEFKDEKGQLWRKAG